MGKRQRNEPETTDKGKQIKKVRGIFERPLDSGIWWISYQRHGQRKREKVGRRSDALALYRVRKTEILSGVKLPDNIKRSAVTFSVLVDRAVEYSESKHKDTRNVRQRLHRIKDAFGQRVAVEITPTEITAWLKANTKTGGTSNRYKATFSLVYNRAVKAQTISVNPARLVDPAKESNAPTRFMTADEEAMLRKVIENPNRVCELVVSLKTGMRLSEQYGLHWHDVMLDKKIIHLWSTKNGLPRDIPMSDEVREMLVALAKADHVDPGNYFGLVFRRGLPRKWFAVAMARAGMTGYRWHDNRHTFCSRLAEQGASISTIMKLAGHKTITMSARYTHMSDATLAEAIRKLG